MSGSNSPPWAEAPRARWTLTEIKGGVEVMDYVLNQPCVVLGRAADQVQIPLHHESCSRQHARIAFDSSGIPWLRDYQSTHGTFVNKKRLPPEAVGKIESYSTKAGSRGVIVYPGDVLQFGASTRIFCLEGPSQFQRGADVFQRHNNNSSSRASLLPEKQQREQQQIPQEQQQQQRQQQQQQQQQQSPKDAEEGVSWGISMQEVDDTDKNPILDIDMRLPESVPQKYEKALKRINALKYKLTNLRTESERIRRKGDDLTEGQQRQLTRNEEREKQLEETIQEREEELYHKLHPEKSLTKRDNHRDSYNNRDDDNDDDDYEFYDRTKKSSNNTGGSKDSIETEKSLSSKWVELHQAFRRNQQEWTKTNDNVSLIHQRLQAMKEVGDEEAAFFVQNDLQLAKDQHAKVEEEKRTIHKDMVDTERLLKIVNPNIYLDREAGYVGSTVPPKEFLMAPPPDRAAAPVSLSSSPVEESWNDNNSSATAMPPPSSKLVAKAANASVATSQRMMPPPAKRKRTIGPSKPPQEDDNQASQSYMDDNDSSLRVLSPKSRRNVRQPVVGTLAALAKISGNGTEPSTVASIKSPVKAPLTSDPRKDEWKAPKDQDGSGFTKLNAKFAGRY